MFKDLRLIFTTIVVACFIGFGIYFIRSIYQFEHASLVKSLNESLTKAIEAFHKYSMAKKEMNVILPDSISNEKYFESENYIRNGDFNLGDTLFYSACEKLSDSIVNFSPNPKGWQWITTDPGETRGNWAGKGYDKKGPFLLIDGPTNKNVVVWEQEVDVKPKTNYVFGVKLASVATNAGLNQKYHWSLARVNININDNSFGIAMAPETVNNWLSYNVFWANDTLTKVKIQLMDENPGGLYNDFGIDNISLVEYTDSVPMVNQTNLVTLENNETHKNTLPDTSALHSMVAYEMGYIGLNIPYTIEVLSGAETKHFYRNVDVVKNEGGKYFERYCIEKNRLYTSLYYLDKRYSVHLSVSNYSSYIIKRNIVIILILILLMVFSLVLLWMVIRYTRKEKQMAAFKYQLTNNITHELKTPVATILAAMDALQHHGLLENKEKTIQYLQITTAQAKKLNVLIDNALNLSMVDEDKIKLAQEGCDLNVLVVDMLKECALPDYVDMQHLLYESVLLVKVNKVHFNNVLHILIDNAIKYRNGKTVRIFISTGIEQGRIFFRISDDGIGIEKKHHKFVFEKYYRVSNNDTHQVKGHGLGLSYVKTIADALNITIKLESSLGNGTEITLFFKHE